MNKALSAIGLAAILTACTDTPSKKTVVQPENSVEQQVEPATSHESVSRMIRTTPYEALDDSTYERWYTIRSWVLHGEGPCADKDRHLFAELDGTFAGYMSDSVDAQGHNKSNEKIDRIRKKWLKNDIHDMVSGITNKTGYPFAYSCDNSKVEKGIDRALGNDSSYLLHGSYKGFSIPESSPISVVDAIDSIDSFREYNLDEDILKRLHGQVVKESSGLKNITSHAGAIGMLQIMPQTLGSCNVADDYKTHRFAQIDCALSELERAYTYLEPFIDDALSHVSESKRDDVKSWMATQGYHAGMGNISKLFTDGQAGKASEYINSHADEFSSYDGNDLAMFLMIHNYGRASLGPHATTYTLDTEILGDKLYERRH